MRRRTVLASGTLTLLTGITGCLGFSPNPSRQDDGTTNDTKPGTVDNHRTTAVEAISHNAVRQSTDDGHQWVVRVVLRLIPQDPETATPFPIGVFFIFFDDDDRKLYREYEKVPANTGSNAYTRTLSTAFRPSEASSSTFARYRIDLVHP